MGSDLCQHHPKKPVLVPLFNRFSILCKQPLCSKSYKKCRRCKVVRNSLNGARKKSYDGKRGLDSRISASTDEQKGRNNLWNNSSRREMNWAPRRAIYQHSTNSIMWNMRVTGSPQFKNHLLNHVNNYELGIVILVETKISGDRARAICESLPFNNFKIVDPKGFKGGICVLWDDAQVQLEYISSSL